MKKIGFLVFTLSITICNYAQKQGIVFQRNTTWAKVLAKAKKENKYVFVDFYTSWCGPCKMMDANVFPDKKVGDFYNKNFVCVKMQHDQTNNDDLETRRWYETAGKLANTFNVNSYPTFLIFSSAGALVHRYIGSGTIAEFLTDGANAIDKNKQYYTLKNNFDKTNKDSSYLLQVMEIAFSAYDNDFGKTVGSLYMATQKDILTVFNLKYLWRMTTNSTDAYFPLYLNNGAKIDQLIGEGASERVINNVILNEDILPFLTKNRSDLNWDDYEKVLNKKYPSIAKKAFFITKVFNAETFNVWDTYVEDVSNYVQAYGSTLQANEFAKYATNIFNQFDDTASLNKGLAFAIMAKDKALTQTNLSACAKILHKLGRSNEAHIWEFKAKELALKDEGVNNQYKTKKTKN